jgi:hypothetical protein
MDTITTAAAEPATARERTPDRGELRELDDVIAELHGLAAVLGALHVAATHEWQTVEWEPAMDFLSGAARRLAAAIEDMD